MTEAFKLDKKFVADIKAGNPLEDADFKRVGMENAELRKQWAAISNEAMKLVSPAGALGLPESLDAARIRHAIPDEAFRVHCLFSRVYIYQLPLPDVSGGTFGGGSMLFMPGTMKARERHEANRGVIVSAGLRALDCLRSNGVDLGHIVTFCRLAPWKHRVGIADGKEIDLLVLQANDITGSETLTQDLREGAVSIDVSADGQHMFMDKNGRQWSPVDPELPQEY